MFNQLFRGFFFVCVILLCFHPLLLIVEMFDIMFGATKHSFHLPSQPQTPHPAGIQVRCLNNLDIKQLLVFTPWPSYSSHSEGETGRCPHTHPSFPLLVFSMVASPMSRTVDRPGSWEHWFHTRLFLTRMDGLTIRLSPTPLMNKTLTWS